MRRVLDGSGIMETGTCHYSQSLKCRVKFETLMY